MRPSDRKNEAAEAVSPMDTSDVTLCAQCFFWKKVQFSSDRARIFLTYKMFGAIANKHIGFAPEISVDEYDILPFY